MADEDKDKKEEEIEIIEEGAEKVASEDTADKADKNTEDERLRIEDDDDDDVAAKDGETPEERSKRRREERRKRKERQRRAEADNKEALIASRQEIETLRNRLSSIEKHTLDNESRSVDQRMLDAQKRYQYAEDAYADAVARGDGIGSAKALRARDEASSSFNAAQQLKARLATVGQEREKVKPRQEGPDPTVARKAKEFISRHDWIDPTGKKDQDSAVAKAIDVRLQEEGFDPKTDDYWSELEGRLKKAIPERFKPEQTGRKSPPVNNGSDRSGSGKKTFILSPARKAALVESGDWEIPERRNIMIRQYMKYDADNKKQ